jgi:hypothetical protein
MPIYEATASSLTAIPATSFAALGLKERADLQRLLAARIEALEHGLLVLAEEFGDWADSVRRIDLLCLDTRANLVVVELKRDETGGHMELQALRYAAMVSAMTFDQAAATLARQRDKTAPDHAAARAAILAHLGWTEPDEEAFAQETRIILASADFTKEITTTVIWLRESFGVDIRCVRLRPHRMPDNRLLLDIQPLIPLPEAAEFQTQIGAKQAAQRKERAERHELRYRFWASLLDAAKPQTNLHATRSPSDDSWVWGGIGRTGFGLNYVIRQRDGQVELKLDGNVANGATAFAALKADREAIESAFGGPLEWEEPPAIGGWRIRHPTEGGYRDAESEWPSIQDRMIKAMIRLDAAVRSRVAKLP